MKWMVLSCLVLLACRDEAGATSSGVAAAGNESSATTATTSVGATTAVGSTGSGGNVLPTTSASAEQPLASASVAPTATAKPTATATSSASGTTASPTATPTTTASAITAAPGSAGAVGLEVDALFAPLARYKAKFIQKYKQKITGTEKESKGTVFVQRPDRISFRYDAPNKNRIVSDGKTLKIYVESDKQMFEHPVEKTEYPGALSFVMGKGMSPSFTFAFNEKATFDKGPVLVGTPRAPTPSYESVLFYIDKTKLAQKNLGAVVAVLIVDAQGNRNRFEFFDAEEPKEIDASEFVFTPPAGTNVTK